MNRMRVGQPRSGSTSIRDTSSVTLTSPQSPTSRRRNGGGRRTGSRSRCRTRLQRRPNITLRFLPRNSDPREICPGNERSRVVSRRTARQLQRTGGGGTRVSVPEGYVVPGRRDLSEEDIPDPGTGDGHGALPVHLRAHGVPGAAGTGAKRRNGDQPDEEADTAAYVEVGVLPVPEGTGVCGGRGGEEGETGGEPE